MKRISSDDPNAAADIKERIAVLEALQGRMKTVNAAWRKAGKPDPDDVAGWEQIASTLSQPIDALDRVRANMRSDPLNRGPFPNYAIANNNANIKRNQKRLKELESKAEAVTTETEVNGVRVVENAEENRIQLIFEERPSETIRSLLKRQGFRWAPSKGAWQRHLNNAGRYASRIVVEQLETVAD